MTVDSPLPLVAVFWQELEKVCTHPAHLAIRLAMLAADHYGDDGVAKVYVRSDHPASAYEAAQLIAGKASRKAREVFAVIERSPVTDEEGTLCSGISGNTWRPRRTALVEAHYVKDSGTRRPTRAGIEAIVWQVTPAGLEAAARWGS